MAPLVRTGGSRHTGLAAPPHRNIQDGGVTFTQMEFPMEEVTELPDTADELGYTIADYDYAEMPQVSDGQWTVIIKAEYSSYEGLRFTSNDNGKTWMYEGLSTGEGDLQ